MSVWRVDGKTPHADVRSERIHAGTVGGEHAVPKGFAASTLNAIIDDTDSRVTYGWLSGTTGQFSASREGSFDYDGSSTWLQTVGAVAQCNFTGTSIAVMARTNINSGSFQVYIDGDLTSGRILQWGDLNSATYGALGISATTSPIVLTSVAFLGGATSGEVMIGAERITFSGVSGTTLTGVTRGANLTIASSHVWTEAVYIMSSTVPCWDNPAGGANFSDGRLVYYNPFLQPGQHRVQIVCVSNPDATQQGFWFDGFVTGELIGSRHVSRQIGTVVISATTDGTGYASLGSLNTRTGVSIMGFLGWNLMGTTGAYPVVSCIGNGGSSYTLLDGSTSWDSTTIPSYILLGTASTAYSVQLIFTYIGESI